MTHARIHHLARQLANARARAEDAKAAGDFDGYRYARAEARRVALRLAEG
jgi:hypothetical protein